MPDPTGRSDARLDLLGLEKAIGQVTISPEEHPDDRALRLSIERRAAWIGHLQGGAVFILMVVGLVLLAWLAYREAFLHPAADADTKRWALAALTSIVTGAVSFVAGRKIGGK